MQDPDICDNYPRCIVVRRKTSIFLSFLIALIGGFALGFYFKKEVKYDARDERYLRSVIVSSDGVSSTPPLPKEKDPTLGVLEQE